MSARACVRKRVRACGVRVCVHVACVRTRMCVLLQKNKVISINYLTYKVPQKSHATKELVGYKLGMSILTTHPGFQKNLAMPEGVT